MLIVAVLVATGVALVDVGRPELLPPLVTLVFLGLGGLLIRRNQRRRRAVESRHREQDGLVETSRKIEELHAQALPHLALLEIEAAALSDAARTEEVLTAREAELEQERLHALETVRLAEDAREVRARLQVLEAQHEGEAECRLQARERLAALERDFHAWKRDAGIPATLGAEAAREFLEDVRSGRDALEERDRLAAELRRVETDVLSFRADVDAVLAGLLLCTLVREVRLAELHIHRSNVAGREHVRIVVNGEDYWSRHDPASAFFTNCVPTPKIK